MVLAGLSNEYELVRMVASATNLSLELLIEMILDCEAR